jgi:hypothetical protein
MTINSQNHWQVYLFTAFFGETPLNITVNNVIFDSGSSLNYILLPEYNQFMTELLKYTQC